MSSIDFQNGFLCGMATRGMVGTGITYSRYVEVDVFDGFTLSTASYSDVVITTADDKNENIITDDLMLSIVNISDMEGVVLI